jgi:sugar O-acyltransferase (sialic acid O-acetyltransferase NeuD family)
MFKKIVLIGGGGHCISAIDVIERQNEFKILGVLDNVKSKGEKVLGYEILGSDNEYKNFIDDNTYFLITIGQIKTSEIRYKIARNFCDLKMATIISPLAYVSKHAKIAEGSIIMHHVCINAGVTIGKHCIINTKANIEHGVFVGDFCHISTAAVVNGDCTINSGTFIGSNATIKQGLTIKENTVISAGEFIKYV